MDYKAKKEALILKKALNEISTSEYLESLNLLLEERIALLESKVAAKPQEVIKVQPKKGR